MNNKSLQIVSYNLNGIRAALKKDWLGWIDAHNFDIIGVQETKAQEEQVDLTALAELGFQYQYWHSAQKKGYSGVAIFSKIEPDLVVEGMGEERFDSEGRVIRADFGDLTLINAYFPSGTSGDARQAVKIDFLHTFFDWIMELKKERPNLIIQGDYNIANQEIDLHAPKRNHKTTGFLPEERAWMDKLWAEGGFVDSFRSKNEEVEKYSWWSYRGGARGRNKGWRLDYQAVSDILADNILESDLLNDAVHSDHCPCWLKLSL
jgi:exodeoxyribonuclease-3